MVVGVEHYCILDFLKKKKHILPVYSTPSRKHDTVIDKGNQHVTKVEDWQHFCSVQWKKGLLSGSLKLKCNSKKLTHCANPISCFFIGSLPFFPTPLFPPSPFYLLCAAFRSAPYLLAIGKCLVSAFQKLALLGLYLPSKYQQLTSAWYLLCTCLTDASASNYQISAKQKQIKYQALGKEHKGIRKHLTQNHSDQKTV